MNSCANEPTFGIRKFFAISKLKKPRRFNLVSYRAIVPPGGITILTHRLCGLPGDTLEIKAGILYVNGQDADKSLRLKHIFKMPIEESHGIEYDKKQAYTIPPYTNTLYISLEDKEVEQKKLHCERYVLPSGLRDEDIYMAFKKNWNQDHFGPLRVPQGKWFVLGDNRGNSRDSRYLGLVEQSKYVGTVLWKSGWRKPDKAEVGRAPRQRAPTVRRGARLRSGGGGADGPTKKGA
jgi:signal peptidase I